MSKIDPIDDEMTAVAHLDPEAARIKQLTRMALFNLFLATLSMGVTLWITRAEKGLAVKFAEHRERRAQECASTRVITTPTPPLVDPEGKAPPQDPPRNGYLGAKGAEISAAMRLKLEAVQPGATETKELRLGSQAVLPSETIHVVNLWATWCEPCREEMPDFRAMFARRSDWGDQVRFVPIKVKEHNDPVRAYQELVGKMPQAPMMLADRSEDEALTKALTTERELFTGELPVTLLLDCNRRVRWAQFSRLGRQSFVELEGYIDRLRAELDDDSPGAWCQQAWPGNGRCEGLEHTAEHHSLEDCGELKRKAAPTEAPVEAAPPPVEACPEGMIRTADGQCSRKLRGALGSPKTPQRSDIPATCGNGKCDAKENSDNCCQDCGCPESQTCRQDGEGGSKCLRGLKGR